MKAVIFEPNEPECAAPGCDARHAAGHPVIVKRRVASKRHRAPSFLSSTTLAPRDMLEIHTPAHWPECETCGKGALLALACRQCSSPVCGDCTAGACGVCRADLQQTFRGCDLCGRVLLRRATRMCVHCTEVWCGPCMEALGTCGCGELGEGDFLLPPAQVEAAGRRRRGRGGGCAAGLLPRLSTASSCNLPDGVAGSCAGLAVGAPLPLLDGQGSCTGGAMLGAAAAMAVTVAVVAAAPTTPHARTEGWVPVGWPVEGADDDEHGSRCSTTGARIT